MTSLPSGTITRDAVCSENSSAPVMSPASSSTSPWRVDSCTIDCTSSRVKEEVTSSFGSIRISFRMWLADQFRATMTGFTSRAMNIRGGASSRTARSGSEKDRFFGTISPNTTCRNDTTTSVTMNANLVPDQLPPGPSR